MSNVKRIKAVLIFNIVIITEQFRSIAFPYHSLQLVVASLSYFDDVTVDEVNQ